ncbi:MAG: nuclear transport factor 2 family protein [Gammaproteobacteria bacterium]|nr:nuclear transport factor 2 family protein [Gammaproteobacteria bacterium]MCP5196078.1 nuclear transport factor 2 family protein [Gammaproteobacteria bacterium]
MHKNPQEFAMNWIEAWNSHDLDRILSHYTDDFAITTPMIKLAMGIDQGTLRGKENIRQYWATALQKIPDLHFELMDVTQSVDSIALYYTSVMGKRAIEVMFLDDKGKVNRVIAHYSED